MYTSLNRNIPELGPISMASCEPVAFWKGAIITVCLCPTKRVTYFVMSNTVPFTCAHKHHIASQMVDSIHTEHRGRGCLWQLYDPVVLILARCLGKPNKISSTDSSKRERVNMSK